MPIGYIRQMGDHPRPASRLDVEPADAGIAGAKLANEENNAGGQFIGDSTASTSQPCFRRRGRRRARRSCSIAGTISCSSTPPADTLLKLSDWAKDKDILLFNVRATDVSLRQEDCRANVMHVVPDRYMLADALAQYLVMKKWTNWLLVHGSTPGDLAYAEPSSARPSRFGANIVDAREYKDISGGRRDDVGTIPPGKQASNDRAFAANPDYQIIVVADEDQQFGPLYALSRRRRRTARGGHDGPHRHDLEPRPREMGRDPGQQNF